MNRRSILALLGTIVVLLTLNLMALEPRDDAKPMVSTPKRCVGITSQSVDGQYACLFRAFEDGSVELMRVDLRPPGPARPGQWRPLSPPPGAGKPQPPQQ
ncbi:MAG TPA: hypothetical protein PKG54_06660 [Phycisphaerae bacterium]|jgi:hypothetical protein|nr:hypothetical protein [Phycisphaerae bacterium]HOB74189.1 hypothetical protein [Phycisphaerae bacterium]HOJ54977.1 hypothetical protein [Phycisphaerae bacterium]HOL27002.1 hypothetical protein [Phycisphaerae bacterium]HPP21431.1 hypothetical protein [Phycisphaerae bacterium]